MTTTTAPAFRYLGITDECVECQCCGKADLRSTVVLAVLDADRNTEDITYYGSTCAARALGVRGGGRSVLQSARWAHDKTLTEGRNARACLHRMGADDLGNFPTRGRFERAVTTYVSRTHPSAFGPQTRDEWATLVAGHAAHWAAQVADAKTLNPVL